jgi:hypothetical protein
LEGTTGHVDRPDHGLDATGPAAGRTGLLLAEALGLLAGGLFEGAGQQSTYRGLTDLFHVGEIDIEVRPLVAIGAADDNSSPLSGGLGDAFEIFGGQLARTHDEVFLDVRA